MIGATWVICSVGSFEVSYPHYIDRVYGTKADPLSDGNPGSVCCYDIAEYGPEGIICCGPEGITCCGLEGIAMWTGRSWPGKAYVCK